MGYSTSVEHEAITKKIATFLGYSNLSLDLFLLRHEYLEAVLTPQGLRLQIEEGYSLVPLTTAVQTN